MNLSWLAHRLRSMSALEIIHRVDEQVKRARWRRYRGGWLNFHIEDGPLPIISEFGLRLDAACARDPALRNRIAVETNLLRSGNFSLLGHRWPAGTLADLRVVDPELFLRDPITRKSWPNAKSYCFDVPYRDVSDRSDVKYLWEINRLQFLQVAAAEARLTDDQSLARKILEIFFAWMDANPPFCGPNWCSGIELALRLVTLLIVLSFLGGVKDRDQRIRLRAFINAHAFWIARYPSRFSSANNHLVAEALGLFLANVLVPDLPGAVRNAKHGQQCLEQEAVRQIFDDGIGVEQSPTYTAFSLEMFGLAALIGRLIAKPFSSEYERQLANAADSLCWFTDSSGHVPAIGDNDEGRIITLTCAPERRYVPSVAAAIGSLLHRPDLVTPARESELRDAIFDTRAGVEAPVRGGMQIFATGGYTVVREHEDDWPLLLVFDHGPLGYLSIAAHGHADALAIWLHVGGVPVFVDAGTFLYHAGGVWRDILRSTAAHNTLAVENEGASIASGQFNWSHKAIARLRSQIRPPNWSIEAEHDGYASRFGVTHCRRLTRTANGFDVIDSLAGAMVPHAVSIRFLLAPDLKLVSDNSGWSTRLPNGAVVSIQGPAGFKAIRARGDEVAPAGWISTRFGDREPADQLLFNGRLGTEAVTTRIVIAGGG